MKEPLIMFLFFRIFSIILVILGRLLLFINLTMFAEYQPNKTNLLGFLLNALCTYSPLSGESISLL